MSESIYQRLSELLTGLPVSQWGIGDIRDKHPASREYPQALSLVVAFEPGFEEYSEEKYRLVVEEVAAKFERIVPEVTRFFEREGVKFRNGSAGGSDLLTPTAAFPHKLAAQSAGIGWIGKSSLLVTHRNGPRVRLATFLLDAGFPFDQPVAESKCGSCTVCVDSCPHGCIKGVNWAPGVSRDELIDAHRCSSERAAEKQPSGKKQECGFCLLVCPHGNKSGKVSIRRRQASVAA